MAQAYTIDTEAALDRAVEVFWEKGYEASSVDDLLQRMAISRGTFYSSFGGKSQLFLAVLDRYGDRVIGTLLAHLDGDPSARRAVTRLFGLLCDHAVSGGPLRGCLVTNAAIEAGRDNAVVVAKLADLIARIQGGFAAALSRGVALGEFPASADIPALAQFLTGAMQGLLVMSKVAAPPESLRNIVKVVLVSLPRPAAKARRQDPQGSSGTAKGSP